MLLILKWIWDEMLVCGQRDRLILVSKNDA